MTYKVKICVERKEVDLFFENSKNAEEFKEKNDGELWIWNKYLKQYLPEWWGEEKEDQA